MNKKSSVTEAKKWLFFISNTNGQILFAHDDGKSFKYDNTNGSYDSINSYTKGIGFFPLPPVV